MILLEEEKVQRQDIALIGRSIAWPVRGILETFTWWAYLVLETSS